MVKKIKIPAGIHVYELPDSLPETKGQGVIFVSVDLSFVSVVRDYIQTKCEEFALASEDIFAVALLSDELLSNAILASASQHKNGLVVFRWVIFDGRSEIRVMDYAGGFDLEKVNQDIPVGQNINEYLENIRLYRLQNQVVVSNRGKEMVHYKFGRGLKIIRALADEMEIYFHDQNGQLLKTYGPDVIGTIIKVTHTFKTP